MQKLYCLRCNAEMKFLAKEQLQLGKTGWILGDLPNLLAGALEVNIHICPQCKKLEFYASENVGNEESLSQRTCPQCGTVHDFDSPKCPRCKYDYYKN